MIVIRSPYALPALILSASILAGCSHRTAVLAPQPPVHTVSPKPYKAPVRHASRKLNKYLKENAQRNAEKAKDADRFEELQEYAKDVGDAGEDSIQPGPQS